MLWLFIIVALSTTAETIEKKMRTVAYCDISLLCRGLRNGVIR